MHFLEDFEGDEPSHRQYLHNLNKWKKQFDEISQTNHSKNITECIIKFIEYVINYTSGISCRSQIFICQHSFALLQELVDDKFLSNFVEQATQRIFDIVIEEGKNTWCIKKEILKTFNYCLRNVRKDIRYQTARELSDIYLFKIIDSISSYGDYDLQVVIIETIFRMYGKATINARLKDLIPESKELSQSFAEINPERFDEDVRLFLNSLNKISGKIFSIQCDKVKIGDVICIPPIESIKGMWVDFNTWDSAITWYCNESSFREDLSDDDDIWNLITLFVSDVTTVSVHSAAGNPNIIIHCSLQSSCLSKFKDDQPILDQAKYLSLLLTKSEETDKLVDNILPELFGNKLQKRPEARINCNKKISMPTTLEYKPLNIIVRRRSGSVGADGKLSVSMTTSYLDPFNMKSDDTAPSSRSSRAITITSSNSLSSSENDEFEEIPRIQILSGRCSASSRDRGIDTPSKKVSISISKAQRSRMEKRKEAELNISSNENATISSELFETAQYSAKSSESFQTAELDSQRTYVLNATKNEQNINRNYGRNGELPELTEDFSSLEVNIFQNNFVSKKVSCKTYVSTFNNAETPRMECNDIEERSEFGVEEVVPGNTCKAIKSPGFEERIILTGDILSDEHTKISSELLNNKPQFEPQNESSNSSNSNGDSMKVNIFKDVRNVEKNRHTNANGILEENRISQDVKNLPLHELNTDSAAKENIPSEIRYVDVNKDSNILDKTEKREQLSSASLKENTDSYKEMIIKECNSAKKSTTAKRIARTEKYTLSVSERRQTMKTIIKENSTLSNDNNMNQVEITKLLSVGNTQNRDHEDKSGRNIPEENEGAESRKCRGRRKKNALKGIVEDNTNKKCKGRPIKTNLKGKGDVTNKKCRGRPKKDIPKRAGDDQNRKRRGRPRKNISGKKEEVEINRTEGNIEKYRHTNADEITKENRISREVKNLPSHTLDNDWAAKENNPSEIRSYIDVNKDNISNKIEKREELSSALFESSKEEFPKGTGNDENQKRRGRPKKNISGEKEEVEINCTEGNIDNNANEITKENQISRDVKKFPSHTLDNVWAAKKNIPRETRSYLDINKDNISDKIEKKEELSSALFESSKEEFPKGTGNDENRKRRGKPKKNISGEKEEVEINRTEENIDNNANGITKENQISRDVKKFPAHALDNDWVAKENIPSETRSYLDVNKDNTSDKIEKREELNSALFESSKDEFPKGTGNYETQKRRGRPKKNISGETGEAEINRTEGNIENNANEITKENQTSRDIKNFSSHTLDNDWVATENIPSETRSYLDVNKDNTSDKIEKREELSSALFESSKDEFPKGTGNDETQKRRGRPKKNISGETGEAEINRTEGNIEKYRHNNANEITKENQTSRDIKNFSSHTLDNDWATKENSPSEIRSYPDVNKDNISNEIEKREELSSALFESSEDEFPKGTGNDENQKRRGRPKKNILGETEEAEINRTEAISEGYKLNIDNEGSEHVDYNNVVQENITCSEKLDNIISETVIQKEVWLRHNKSADLEVTKRCHYNDSIKVVTEDNEKTKKFPTEIIEFTANDVKQGNEDYLSAVDRELLSTPVINKNLAVGSEIATKENMDENKILVVELQKIVLENEIRTIREDLVDLNGKINNKETEHDTLEQEVFNHSEVVLCKNKRNNVNEAIEDIQSLHQDEVLEDDNEGDYSGRIHTETDPLPKVLIDPELAFETLFGKKEIEIGTNNVILSSCGDIQVVKETESNIAHNELEKIIPDDLGIDILSSLNEIKDNLNPIQIEKIIESEHANNPEKIEQTMFDRKNIRNKHQKDDHSNIRNNIEKSQVAVESVVNVTDLMKNDENNDHLKTSRINRVRFSKTSQDQKNDDARKLVKMRKTDLDATQTKKSTNLISSIDANQTVSTTHSVQRRRKLYNPDDLTDLENMSLIQNESLQQKEKDEIPSLVTNNSGLKDIFKNFQETVVQSLDHPIISRRNWNATSSAQKNEKKTIRKLSKGEISYKDVKKEQEQMQEIIRKRKSSDTNHQAKRARKSNLYSFFSDMVGGLREELGMESLTNKLKKNGQEVSNRKRTYLSGKNNIMKEKYEKINKYRKSDELKRAKYKKPVVKSKTLPLPDSSSSSSLKSGRFNKTKNNEPEKTSRKLALAESLSSPTFSIGKEKQYNDNNILPEINFDIERSPMNIEEKGNMGQKSENRKEKINILSNITIHPRMSEEVQPSKRSRLSHQSYTPNIIHKENHVKDVCIHQNPVYPSYLGTKVSKPAPLWESIAVFNGEFVKLKSTDYLGKYLVLLFYPLDFTSVCPMEILAFSERIEEFQRMDTKVVGCSVDSHFVHSAWINTRREDGGLGKINFPLLSDLKRSISKDFGVYLEDLGHTLRGLVIIDVRGIIRQITMNDLPVGSSVNETLRLVREFQNADKSISQPNLEYVLKDHHYHSRREKE